MADSVLMIEDDEDLSTMLSEYLRGYGFELVACPNAAQGLAKLEEDRYSALLLDVMLPDLDGFEICRRVRANSAHWDLPILMLTRTLAGARRKRGAGALPRSADGQGAG